MSVLIKGMEMPKNIGVIVTIYPDGHVDKMADSFSGKTEQFKAVPVPTPHGDLVDFNEIELTWYEDADGIHQECSAQTVIESEE